jgi:Secretion system C-terminal sorting domain
MKKLILSTWLFRLAFAFVLTFSGQMMAIAQEKLDLSFSDPTTCDVALTATTPIITVKPAIPATGGSPAISAVTQAGLGVAAGTLFVVRKVGFEVPISGSAPTYEVATYTFSKSDVGQEFLVAFMHPIDGMTSRRVRVYDNTGPVIVTTPQAVTIRCSELSNGKVPAPGAIVSVVDGNQTLKTRMPVPQLPDGNPSGITLAPASGVDYTSSNLAWVRFFVNDCYNITFVSYTDGSLTGLVECPVGPASPNCNYGTIIRTWTFKDRYGNTSNVNQTITVVKPRILFPSTGVAIDPAAATAATNFTSYVSTTLNDCTQNAAQAGFPFADWNCNGTKEDGEEVVNGEVVCGRSITAGPSTKKDLCSGSYALERAWTYITCEGNQFYTITQTVKVFDSHAPTVSLYYRDYARIPEEQVVCMGVMKIVQYVYATAVDHWQEGYKGHTSVNKVAHPTDAGRLYTDGSDIGLIQINPLMDLGSCETASIDVMLGTLDPECSKMTTIQIGTGIYAPSAGASNIRFNGMTTMKLNDGMRVKLTGDFFAPAGSTTDPFFYLEGVDPCGNITRIKVVVNIIDNVTPTNVCENKVVTLTNTGQAIITGSVFTNKTFDNCTKAFEDRITPLDPMKGRILVRRMGSDCWVENFTVDCKDAEVMVQVRVLDMMNNYSECMMKVKVIDQAGPTCPMIPPVSTICTDPRLVNLESFFTQPSAFDNCHVTLLSQTTPTGQLGCTKSTIIKSWTFGDNQGRTTTCSQNLTVTGLEGYRVKPLAGKVLTCGAYVFDKEAERQAVLANIRLLNTSGVSTCSQPMVEVSPPSVFSSFGYCKIYKIRYSIWDGCKPVPSSSTPTCAAATPQNNGYFRYGLTDGIPLVTAENPCGYIAPSSDEYYQSPDGTFYFERFIYVKDIVKPTSTPPVVAPINVIDNTCVFDFPTITLTGSDLCEPGSTPNSNLFFDWTVTTNKGTATGATATINPANFPELRGVDFGAYTVNYRVSDGCTNFNWYSFKVTGRDDKSPTFNALDKKTVLAYNSTIGAGMSMMDVLEPLTSIKDNCTDEATLRSRLKFVRASDNPSNTYPVTATRQIMFTCADFKGVNPVKTQVWTVDNAGNAFFGLVYVTVQDNIPSACGPRPQSSIVNGSLKTENVQPAKSVTLTASASGTITNTTVTDASGDFSFGVNLNGSYVIKASKLLTDDKYVGVTTFDIARIGKALLGIEPFKSPYHHIAADVDKSGAVDGADMLHIRNFILRKTPSLPAGVWRFIDSKYVFTNPSNPFGEDFPEAINLANTQAAETANFTAVKIGDVNATFTANLVSTVVRNNNALTLNVEDRDLIAGNEYTVNVSAENFNATAFQGTFGIANTTIKSVKASGDLKNYSDGNFGIFANEITTSWNGQAKGVANIFTVSFTANKSGKLSEMMSVGSSLTSAIANDATGTEMAINLKFSTGKVVGGEFALYQNIPNPVAQETAIGFNMPKDGTATLTIYSTDGKTILMKSIDAKAGLNNVIISKSELSSGMLYYRLETADHSATKKMIVIE